MSNFSGSFIGMEILNYNRGCPKTTLSHTLSSTFSRKLGSSTGIRQSERQSGRQSAEISGFGTDSKLQAAIDDQRRPSGQPSVLTAAFFLHMLNSDSWERIIPCRSATALTILKLHLPSSPT